MPTKEQKRAAGRTGISALRPLSDLIASEFVVVTSCAACDFGARTSGRGAPQTGNRTPPLVVRSAINTVRKHVAATGHDAAHVKVIETRAYTPRRKSA